MKIGSKYFDKQDIALIYEYPPGNAKAYIIYLNGHDIGIDVLFDDPSFDKVVEIVDLLREQR